VSKIAIEKDRLMVSGDLDFSTVMLLWKQSLPLISSVKELNFDLAEVSNSNSAGLALLIEWLKYAKTAKKPIRFMQIPEQLKSIISAAGMDEVLARDAL
jgi:phospholipid transport system transporter-binding protein